MINNHKLNCPIELNQILEGHSGKIKKVIQLETKQNEVRLLSIGNDKNLRLWNIKLINKDDNFLSLFYLLAINHSYLCKKKSIVLILYLFLNLKDLQKGKIKNKIIKCDNNEITTIYKLNCGLNNKELIVYANVKNEIKIFNISDNKLVHCFIGGHTDIIHCFIQFNNLLFSASEDCKINSWNLNDYSLHNTLIGHDKSVHCLIIYKINEYKSILISGGKDRKIIAWDINSELILFTTQAHLDIVRCLLQTNDLLISGSNDNDIILWNVGENNFTKIKRLTGHSQPVTSLIQIKSKGLNSNLILSSSWDKMFKLWDIKKGKCLINIIAHTSAIRCLANLHIRLTNQIYFISAGDDSKIKIWNMLNDYI